MAFEGFQWVVGVQLLLAGYSGVGNDFLLCADCNSCWTALT